MRNDPAVSITHWTGPLVLSGFALLVGCGSHNHLAEYAFADHTLGMVYLASPAPRLYTGGYDVRESDDAVTAVVRAGAGVAKHIEGKRSAARLDSASARVNLAELLAHRTVERAGRYLGLRPAGNSDEADYLLEVQMHNFGIDASSDAAAYLYTNAEAVLLDRRSGREIWSAKVHGTDRLTPNVRGAGGLPGTIITAGTLGTVTVADYQRALDELATLSSRVIADELRAALRDARK